MAEFILTAEGKEEMENHLEYLKTVARKEIAEQIKVAREFGDLSENAEYDEAKNEQSRIEGEIAELEKKLRNVTIIDGSALNTDTVSIGSTVSVENLKTGAKAEYTIVGTTEASPQNKRISNESPVGAALLGGKKGETVTVNAPGGAIDMKILDIKKG